jgi:hypothetical protein
MLNDSRTLSSHTPSFTIPLTTHSRVRKANGLRSLACNTANATAAPNFTQPAQTIVVCDTTDASCPTQAVQTCDNSGSSRTVAKATLPNPSHTFLPIVDMHISLHTIPPIVSVDSVLQDLQSITEAHTSRPSTSSSSLPSPLTSLSASPVPTSPPLCAASLHRQMELRQGRGMDNTMIMWLRVHLGTGMGSRLLYLCNTVPLFHGFTDIWVPKFRSGE